MNIYMHYCHCDVHLVFSIASPTSVCSTGLLGRSAEVRSGEGDLNVGVPGRVETDLRW